PAVGEICASWATRAQFEDAERSPCGFLADCSGRVCNCAWGGALSLFSGRRFYRCLTGAYHELGRLGWDLLSLAFCSLQHFSVAWRCSGCGRRLLFWFVVGLFGRALRQYPRHRRFICAQSLHCKALVWAEALASPDFEGAR